MASQLREFEGPEAPVKSHHAAVDGRGLRRQQEAQARQHLVRAKAAPGVEVLNKKSGVFGISGGLSSDFRDLTDAMNAGDKKAKIAMDVFSYRVAKYIGSYAAAMNGVDDIVFTAGIGENDDYVRQEVCKYLGYLGVDFDFEVNTGLRGKEAELTKEGSKVKVFVIPTNEELAIARETLALVK